MTTTLEEDVAAKSDQDLYRWLQAVQLEIESQNKLRARSSGEYFKQDLLDDQTRKEAAIIAQLKERGWPAEFSPYTLAQAKS